MKDQFIALYNECITRPGADKLLEYLKSTDFFTAPASTKFHLSREGGLVEHSIHVFERLKDLCSHEASRNPNFAMPSLETIAICGLLHDVCKANFYAVEMRNKKNEQGFWEKVPFYIVNDQLPYGHGEKSVYIVSGFMRLTRDEAFAIRYHMGFSGTEDTNNVGRALEMFPLAYAVCCADMEAAFLMEGKLEGKLPGEQK